MNYTLKQKVETVLKENEETRNSDITLMIEIWRRFYGVEDTIKVSQLYDLPREDNIKRIRAVFQNDNNQYLPTSEEVSKKRGIEESKLREYLGYSQGFKREETRINFEQNQLFKPRQITSL